MGSRSKFKDKEVRPMTESESKKRRMSGKNYWLLREAGKAHDGVVTKYQEFLKKEARKYNVYPDQIINTFTGKVKDDEGKITRLPKEFIDKVAIEWAKVERVKEKLNNLVDKLAEIYGTWPDLINAGTGEINDKDIEEAKEVKKEDNQESESDNKKERSKKK